MNALACAAATFRGFVFNLRSINAGVGWWPESAGGGGQADC